MEGFLIRAVVVGIGLWLASKIGLGIAFNSTETLIAAALLLGIVNAFVRPVIVILTLPITLLTLGLFLLVINALMIMLVAWFLPGLPGRQLLVGGLCRDRRQPDELGHVRLDRPARPDRSHDDALAPRPLGLVDAACHSRDARRRRGLDTRFRGCDNMSRSATPYRARVKPGWPRRLRRR